MIFVFCFMLTNFPDSLRKALIYSYLLTEWFLLDSDKYSKHMPN